MPPMFRSTVPWLSPITRHSSAEQVLTALTESPTQALEIIEKANRKLRKDRAVMTQACSSARICVTLVDPALLDDEEFVGKLLATTGREVFDYKYCRFHFITHEPPSFLRYISPRLRANRKIVRACARVHVCVGGVRCACAVRVLCVSSPARAPPRVCLLPTLSHILLSTSRRSQ